MNNENELSNKKLSEVAGGTEAGNPEPKYRVGQHLWEYFNITMNYAEFEIVRILKATPHKTHISKPTNQ